ncbi:heavy metal-binding domain-containing protein [Allosphingosinicella humi]
MALPSVAVAKDKKAFVVVNEEVGVPVFPYDITDRPYEVIGEVKAGVRKATIFSKEASQEKIYKELWERAEKLGADAVIKAQYGDSHVTAMSWGKTNATGTAVRFTGAAPATSGAPAAPETEPGTVD